QEDRPGSRMCPQVGMRLDTAQERIAQHLASEPVEDNGDVDDPLLANKVQHELQAAAVEFSRVHCTLLIVCRLDRGRPSRLDTSDLDGQSCERNVAKECSKALLQPGQGLRARIGDVALKGIRVELARGMQFADLVARQSDDVKSLAGCPVQGRLR